MGLYTIDEYHFGVGEDSKELQEILNSSEEFGFERENLLKSNGFYINWYSIR